MLYKNRDFNDEALVFLRFKKISHGTNFSVFENDQIIDMITFQGI